MKKEALFFEPVFKERIWGGTSLETKFGYSIPYEKTGECWAFSAHEHGQSVVKNGVYQNMSLLELWNHHRDLFGNLEGDRFPILTKILDANDDLSVQVHPSDAYAHKNENGEFGKTECWYVIDCEEDAELIIGHHATSKEELETFMKNGNWNTLLRKIKIKPGDFIFVPSGTVHAIGKGTLILETQQNSDVTYRMYDYDRIDDNGNKRELHTEKSLDVITVPFTDESLSYKNSKQGDMAITHYVTCPYFSVQHWKLAGTSNMKKEERFFLCSVIDGEGTLTIEDETYSLQKGDHFLLPHNVDSFTLEGNVDIITSYK